jgi:hypothetical protein
MDFSFQNLIQNINVEISNLENNLFNIDAKAKIYDINPNSNISFPELDVNLVHSRKFDPNGVSIALNAGSTRATTAGIGYVLGLLDIPIGDTNAFIASNYFSTASGGSWFAGPYFFGKQANNLTDEQILGKPIPLEMINELTLNTYNYDKKTFLPQTYYNSFTFLKLVESTLTSLPDKIWINFNGKLFLESYNINNKIVALNEYYANELKINNPNIKDVIIPPPDFPYWISNGSLLYPPIVDKGLTNFAMTAMYAGFLQVLGDGNEKVGGNLIETFAYGCKIPSTEELEKPDILKNVKIPVNQGYFTLDDMIGISSANFGYETYTISQYPSSNLILKNLDKLNPTYDLWCSENPNITNQAQYVDGYLSTSGSGIVPLVARKVKKILSFLTPGPIIDEFIPDLDNDDVIGATIAPLYGQGNNTPPYTSDPNSVQIFESKYFEDFKIQLVNKVQSNGPVYIRQKLNVLPNYQNGVSGNYEVDILYIILRSNTSFNSQLPISISSQFSQFGSPLYNFPNYSEANFKFQGFLDYPKDKSNLLISYCYWCIQQTELKDIIKSFYNE